MSGTLSSASDDRKARLAALRSLKRKLPSEPTDDSTPPTQDPDPDPDPDQDQTSITNQILSGRNYDPITRAPKLGFESDPSSTTPTLEKLAEALSAQTKLQAAQRAAEDAPLDLFKLQPKKPNWDLKRDLDRKLDVLNVRTDNAIAKLVRQRIADVRAEKKECAAVDGDEGDVVGMEGAELLEATNRREREDEDAARREDDAQADLLDAT